MIRLLAGIAGEFVQSGFEVRHHVAGFSFSPGEQRGHEHLAGFGAGVRLGAKTEFAGNDEFSQLAFGKIVVEGFFADGVEEPK